MSVRTPLQCAKCGREADEIADGWKAYLWENETNDNRDGILFCPECDSREFGADDAS